MSNIHWQGLRNLVLVAGHAVYVADDFENPLADDSWLLQAFQQGEPPFYVEHIRRGVELAAADHQSLLIFSGGQTRREAGPRSEAQSYWMIARHYFWWGGAGVADRATTEEFARDSFDNLLFGLCRFRECVEDYPEKVTVVSWAFKEQRFALHRDALSFPEKGFVFEGVNNPADLTAAVRGEERALTLFAADPYGAGEELSRKEEERNPFNRTHPYETSNPALTGLLRHTGREKYTGALPWSSRGMNR